MSTIYGIEKSSELCATKTRNNFLKFLIILTTFIITSIIPFIVISEGIDTTITISSINFNNINLNPTQPTRFARNNDSLTSSENASFSVSSMIIWAIPKSYDFIFAEDHFVQVATGEIYESHLLDLIQTVKTPGYGSQQRMILFCENGKINGTSFKLSADYEIAISIIIHMKFNNSNTIYPLRFYNVVNGELGYRLSANPITINILGIEYLYNYVDRFLDLDDGDPLTYRNPLTLDSIEFKYPYKIITEIIQTPWFL